MKGQKRLSKSPSVFPGLSVKFLHCRYGMKEGVGGGNWFMECFLGYSKYYSKQCQNCKKFHLVLVDFHCKEKVAAKKTDFPHAH